MEELGGRPVWSMSGSEMLSTLDVLDAELARLQTYRLQVIAGLENVGYAAELGAHDTARLLTFRYRLNSIDARRDVRVALALPKYEAVSAALPETAPSELGVDDEQRWLLRPAQAEAIVSALERVPATVPVEDVEVAEQQLVNLARHLSPAELRQAGKQIRDLLDADGPEPDERKAYARESLTMSDADNGVKFRGYLANENAELFRALIHANAKPHKTLDGEHDPRPRDKRQADALTTTLTIAAPKAPGPPWDPTAPALRPAVVTSMKSCLTAQRLSAQRMTVQGLPAQGLPVQRPPVQRPPVQRRIAQYLMARLMRGGLLRAAGFLVSAPRQTSPSPST